MSIAPAWNETKKINGETAGELFGGAVDISGNYAIVGSHSTHDGTRYVRWYQRDDNKNWIEVFRDTRSATGYGSAVAISGSYAVVGGQLGGTAYWYQRDNQGNWKLIQTTDAAGNIYYGQAVDISGNYAIVGGGYGGTSVYFYQRKDNLSWELVDSYEADTTLDALGYSVSISGNYAIAGAYRWYNDTNPPGKVYFFHRKDNLRWEMIYFHEGENDNDNLGFDVSISGNYALVSAPGFSSDTGKVYYFQKKDDRNWELIQTFTGENTGDIFGNAVSISGNYALIGAPQFNNGAANDGKIYFHQKTNSLNWHEKNTFTGTASAADYFGYDVSISGNYAIVGEYQADDAATNAGSIRMYQRCW